MMPEWALKLPWNIIYEESKEANIDPKLIAAFIMAESGGNQLAYRYEKDWQYSYNVQDFAKLSGVTMDSEEMLQKTSIGLLQVMGTVARELGCRKSLAQLFDAKQGIHWGIQKILSLKMKYSNIQDVISAYNMGTPNKNKVTNRYTNQYYVDKVLMYYGEL